LLSRLSKGAVVPWLALQTGHIGATASEVTCPCVGCGRSPL